MNLKDLHGFTSTFQNVVLIIAGLFWILSSFSSKNMFVRTVAFLDDAFLVKVCLCARLLS